MKERKIHRMQGDAGNPALGRFRRVVLPVADDRVTNGRELHADLILQAGHEGDADERRACERALDGIPKLRTSRLGVVFPGQFLEHAVAAEVVDECPFGGGKMAANHGEVLSGGSVGEELSNERIAVRFRLGEEENAGRETVDAMDDERPLPSSFELRGKER
jgi:hypothetical protein